ncbi:hypothetical protein GTCCBUS3UF5_26480 [Geobacillus thermoleovorans CCB_US3_UF5]|jgi:hypothetical protein|uniref:Uncharacterized protein n=1 Tax=Geobacillus thermoleovorans CCB_US3_UF5 TaxID=1111068 RepID=A0ABN3ZVP4_GEOTH|nr:hypothetical protein GTCCBUS3UF5_26480 [Geobacillus thermoleovorans CCB_US3_UF5]GAJ58293.1 hypothetical protein B23_1499 [Geobacillus thermoleovorans B23]
MTAIINGINFTLLFGSLKKFIFLSPFLTILYHIKPKT